MPWSAYLLAIPLLALAAIPSLAAGATSTRSMEQATPPPAPAQSWTAAASVDANATAAGTPALAATRTAGPTVFAAIAGSATAVGIPSATATSGRLMPRSDPTATPTPTGSPATTGTPTATASPTRTTSPTATRTPSPTPGRLPGHWTVYANANEVTSLALEGSRVWAASGRGLATWDPAVPDSYR